MEVSTSLEKYKDIIHRLGGRLPVESGDPFWLDLQALTIPVALYNHSIVHEGERICNWIDGLLDHNGHTHNFDIFLSLISTDSSPFLLSLITSVIHQSQVRCLSFVDELISPSVSRVIQSLFNCCINRSSLDQQLCRINFLISICSSQLYHRPKHVDGVRLSMISEIDRRRLVQTLVMIYSSSEHSQELSTWQSWWSGGNLVEIKLNKRKNLKQRSVLLLLLLLHQQQRGINPFRNAFCLLSDASLDLDEEDSDIFMAGRERVMQSDERLQVDISRLLSNLISFLHEDSAVLLLYSLLQ